MPKKIKISKPFYLKDLSKEEFIEVINKELPVSISKLEKLVDRIYKRYPLIDKVKVAIIVKEVFSSMRELLLLGKIINFNKFLFDMKLTFFRKRHIECKMQLTTPPEFREKEKYLREQRERAEKESDE